ncbi:ATP synthase subunit 4 [Ascobolus immersus RN42]|uniref:ATP synthase subunit 4 n=1 Tax=Ascobolus immersus RN42 TaxID=1160509 RepID=A0A3N4I9C9_ASCIM|nr:ATP synthase subunit 4 [Ascobolus immersus RN42]
MAMRLSKGLAGALRAGSVLSRPTVLPAVSVAAQQTRFNSQVPDPKVKAESVVNSIPGNSLISKVATLSAGAGLGIAAISNELLVINEEAVVAFCLLSVFTAIGKYAGPMYSEWAQGQVDKIRDILNSARADHTQAVKDRITAVKQMEGVVDITKNLFEVSKETAKIEAEIFELEQRTKFVAEAKAVLDSWVRYEAQVKQRQQKELAESVIAKVNKELENPKLLQQILQQSVTEVERILAAQKK